jgi:tetratricopeptide (TPR) repeat protein/uncharacterized membrane protein YgcG
MKLSTQPKRKWRLLLAVSAAFFLSLGVNQLAQTQTQTRSGHVNDFAGTVSDTTRRQLETILTNLKAKTGIEFDVALVQTTGGQDIVDFSYQLAKDWNVGSRTTTAKSLLLVIAVKEKTSFTRFSRSVQGDLPEGVLGDVAQRMRSFIDAGQFDEGLNSGVQHFVKALSQKLAFNAEELNGEPAALDTPSPAATVAETKATDEAGPTVISPAAKESGPASVKTSPRREAAPVRVRRTTVPADDPAEAEAVESTLVLPLEQRIATLKTFLDAHPDSKAKLRATELLVSAHAALGDEQLKQHDSVGGIAQFNLAITEAPLNVTEKLFFGVLSQIPMNLYLRGEPAAATRAAQDIEAKFGNDAKRLLALSAFYARIEQGNEATRLANQAVQLAPDLAEAHQGLGMALHVSLRLDEAVAEYKRALELDPKAKGAQRRLADLTRAAGKGEEAIALYRQQLEADPTDKGARTGLILSLLDLNRVDEAKGELEKTLTEDPKNLVLLAGAAYWFAAHNDNDLAVMLAQRAIGIEPRYTWSQIALARGLVGLRKPLEAERALRFARLYGKFPTLDYELANALVAAALYEEAAEVLSQSFALKDGQIETRLGGQAVVRGANFVELLAPERRASIFQFAAADTDSNAKLLKSLLAFTTVIAGGADGGAVNEAAAVAAGKEFASGDDRARVYRELYVASRLLQKGIGFQTAFELTEAARSSAEAGLTVPNLTLAVQADEYRSIRSQAIAAGGTPDIPEAPRNVLSNLLRGRIEDTAGWALLNQDKLDQAVDHLKRAIAIIPEGTPAASTSLWRLGVALERQDKKAEALTYFIKGYNSAGPDPARRAVVEQLYRKVNGSLDGLDERIGAPLSVAENVPAPATPTPAETGPDTVAPTPTPTASPTTEATPSSTPTPAPEAPAPTPAIVPASASPSPTPEQTPSAATEGHSGVSPSMPTPTPEASPAATPEATAAPTPEATPTPTPEAVATPTPAAPSDKPAEVISVPRSTIKIVGQIKDSTGSPLENVVVVLISPQGTVLTATTDERGNYAFTVATSLVARSYRIIPSKDGFTFEPVDRVVPALSDDVKELDFVSKPKP